MIEINCVVKGENDIKNEEYLNRVLHGSCFEWLPYLEDKSIDMILCDLPYGTTSCKWDTILPFDLLWKEYERIIKDNGAIVLTASQPFTSALVMSNPKLFKYEVIWKKERPTNFMMAKKQIMKYHENIVVFYKNQCTFNPQMEKRKEENKRNNKPRGLSNKVWNVEDKGKYSERVLSGLNDFIYPNSVQEFSMDRGFHPTQKPVSLFEYLIRTYTNEFNENGEKSIVMDNCLGSGTTAVACVNTSRNFIGIEKEWDYCETANKRIEEAKKLKTS